MGSARYWSWWRSKEPAKGMKILNIRGTTDCKCRCGTWKRHWINMTGNEWPKKCGVLGCRNPAQVGGHIRLDDRRTGNHWYILPMCFACNGRKGKLVGARMNPEIEIAWAQKAGTCG